MDKAGGICCTAIALAFAVGCAGHTQAPARSAAPVNSSSCAGSWVRELVSAVNASVAQLVAPPDGGVVALANVYRALALRDGEHKLASFEPIGEESSVAFKLNAAGALIWSARIGAANGAVEAVALTTKSDGDRHRRPLQWNAVH